MPQMLKHWNILLNYSFIKRMEKFHTNNYIARSKSKVQIINFFSDNKRQISKLHKTTILKAENRNSSFILIVKIIAETINEES